MNNKKNSNRIRRSTLLIALLCLGSMSFTGYASASDRTVLGELFTATW